jgi:hypothetical protein
MDRKEGNPIPSSTSPGQAIPHHWWYDKPRDQPLSSPTGGLFGTSPVSYSSSPSNTQEGQEPHKPIPLPSATDWNWWQRRTSLFDDFATD